MGFENGLNFKDMLGGLTELLDNDTINKLTGDIPPKQNDNVTGNNVMIMLNGILSDKNNVSALNNIIAKIKPLLNEQEKSILEKGEPAEGLQNLVGEMAKNPDRIKKLAGILFD